jgi:hypothetical protein
MTRRRKPPKITRTRVKRAGVWHASGWLGRNPITGKGSTARGRRGGVFGRPAGRYR